MDGGGSIASVRDVTCRVRRDVHVFTMQRNASLPQTSADAIQRKAASPTLSAAARMRAADLLSVPLAVDMSVVRGAMMTPDYACLTATQVHVCAVRTCMRVHLTRTRTRSRLSHASPRRRRRCRRCRLSALSRCVRVVRVCVRGCVWL
jgi:hypothetical protein